MNNPVIDLCFKYRADDDNENKQCNAPCDTEEKLKRCFNHLAKKLHPDRNEGKDLGFDLMKDLYNDNIKNLRQRQRQQQTRQQPRQNNPYGNLTDEQLQKHDEQLQRRNPYGQPLTDDQKFITFVIMVFITVIMKYMKDMVENDTIKFGGKGKKNRQNGGDFKQILYMIFFAILLLTIALYDDGEFRYQKSFARDLMAVLEENGQDVEEYKKSSMKIEEITNSYTHNSTPLSPSPPNDSSKFSLPKQENLEFKIGRMIPYEQESIPYYSAGPLNQNQTSAEPLPLPYQLYNMVRPSVLFNNEVARLASAIDLSQLTEMVQSLVKLTNERVRKNVMNFDKNTLVIDKEFFKKSSSKFEKDNKEYIEENRSLSCVNINNCDNLFKKITDKAFLVKRIKKMEDLVTIPNVQLEIKKIANEWSGYFKHSNLKHFLIELNSLDNKLDYGSINFSEYKKSLSKLVEQFVLRIGKIEDDVNLIVLNIETEGSDMNRMIDKVVAKSERNLLVATMQDWVFIPAVNVVEGVAEGTGTAAAKTLMKFINGIIENATLSKKSGIILFITVGLFLSTCFTINVGFELLLSPFKNVILNVYKGIRNTDTKNTLMILDAQRQLVDAQRQLVDAHRQLQVDNSQNMQMQAPGQYDQISREVANGLSLMQLPQNNPPQIEHISRSLPPRPRGGSRLSGGGKKSRKQKVNKYKTKKHKRSTNMKSRKHKK